jgi:hypothetical protein
VKYIVAILSLSILSAHASADFNRVQCANQQTGEIRTFMYYCPTGWYRV